MRISSIAQFALAILLPLLGGCAPQLGLRLTPPDVVLEDEKGGKELKGVASGAKVKIGSFLDGRSSDTLATVDGREVLTDGEVGPAVQTGFERQLRAAGARVSLLKSATVEGEVVDWRARVSPDFPASSVVANAKVKVTVRSASNDVLYRATYTGEANKKHPFLGESDIQAVLGTAMASAIEAAIKDQTFLKHLGAQ